MDGTSDGTVSRDVAAQAAFEKRDVETSILIHKHVPADEKHSKAGGSVKSIVYGGLDGILTSMAHISGAAGGSLSVAAILVIGFSNLLADGLAMGLGDALGGKSEAEYILHERSREVWEYDNNKEGELHEMVDIFVSKGLTLEDATRLVELNSKYKDYFINTMMIWELGLQVPDEDDNPWMDGLVTFLSFLGFGTVPLLGYLIIPPILNRFPSLSLSQHSNILFGASFGITALTLFGLGAFQSRFTIKTWYWSGLQIMIFGMMCAAVSYAVGYVL